MAVRKVNLRGKSMWRARVIVEGVERKAFRNTRAEALKAEAELRAQLEGPPPRKGKGPSRKGGSTDGRKKKRKEVPNGTRPKRSKQIPPVPTLIAFTDDFLRFCATPMASPRGANRASTIEEKEQVIRCYILPAFGNKRLDQITTREVDVFGMRLATRLSRATIGNIMGTLQRMLRVAQRWNLIDKLPEIQTNKGKPDRIERDQFFSFEETERLLQAAEKECYPLMLVAVRTGLRTGELRGLRRTDLDLEDHWVHVRRQIDKKGRVGPPKNGKPRTVELAWDAVEVLSALPQRNHLVFPDEDGEPFAVNALERAVKAACKGASLVTEDGKPKRLGGHALRHTWASHSMMKGIPPKVVMEYGGWSSLAMLERYSHLVPQDVRGQMNKLAPPRS